MRTMQVREAKAGLSALIEAAERGEATMITRHGKPAAMVVPVEEGRKLFPDDSQKRFVDHLRAFPGGIEFDRNQSPSRDIEL